MKPSVRRELVDYAVNTHTVSLRRACKVVGISDSVYRYNISRIANPMKALLWHCRNHPNAIRRMALVNCLKSCAVRVIGGIINAFIGYIVSCSLPHVQGQILLFAFIHKRRQAWNYRLIIISECINFLSKGIKQVQEQRW